tara:strand:+ start:3391 stop:3915 length:525 start_codon:yes stop_codon:yes gene_type:complete
MDRTVPKHNLPDNWPLPNEFLSELGRISVLFGLLESNVNLAISKLSGYDGVLDWRSAVTTAHANFKQRVEILETLLHELHDEYPSLKEYSSIIKDLKAVQAGRNKYSHNIMGFDEYTGKVQLSSLSARGTLKPKVENVSIDDLKDLSARIHLTHLSLHALITGAQYQPIWEDKC